MKKAIHLILSVFLVIAVILTGNSCKRTGDNVINPEFARYIAAFTSGSVSSTSSIQIELAQDMPAVEINKEIDQELFEFSPSVKGKAYWTSTRTIKFVPEPGELKSGQKYDAWFKLDKVMQVDKKYKEFYFYFRVPQQNFNVDVLPYSPTKDNDLTWNSVQGTLFLADEAPIDKIEKMLSVKGGSNTAQIKIMPSEQKGVYKFSIDSLKRGNTPTDYVLHVNGKPIDADKHEKYTISIPKLGGSNYSVIDARVVYDPQECIRVAFSDPLSSNQNIQGLISLNGIDNFSYDIQKNVLKLYLDNTSNSENVSLNIYKELKNQENKQLDKSYNYEFALSKNKPEIKLLNTTGNILPNSENLILPFQAVNLWAVDIKIIKIFENNVLGYLQSNDFGGGSDLRRFGRLIMKKRIRLDEDHSMQLNQWNNFSIDLSTLIKRDPGAIYRVELSMKQEYSLYPCGGAVPQIPQDATLERFDNQLSEEDEAAWDVPSPYYYDSDIDWDIYDWDDRDDPCKPTYYMNKKSECIVFSSNMGIIAKLGTDKKMMVSVTDILTTEPMSGVEVNVYNYQMQLIGSGKTDGEGFAAVEYKGGVPFAIITAKDKEKGYLKVTSNLSLSLSNFDVSGKEIQKGLKGYIYGERGVWRPGDTIYLSFILEDKDKTLPKDHPVSLEIFTPRGQLFQKYISTNNVDGFYTFKVVTNPDSETGGWQAVIKVGGATFTKRLSVETVKPNRLKIRLDVGELVDASKGSFVGNLSSQWLHGSPASNLKAKVEMTLSAVTNPFKGYEQYSFNNPATTFNSDTYTLFDGRLDGSGNATVSASLPRAENAPGMLRANFISQVFESGGDASTFAQTAAYSPFSTYVGVKSPAVNEYEWLETDTDNMIDIISVNAQGKPINRNNINVKVYKVGWSWWWSSNNEDLSSYVNSTSAKIVLDQTVSTVNGKAKVKLRIEYPEWGRYLVLVSDPQSGHKSGRILYIDWPSWRGRSAKEDPNGLTMLSFSTDKQTYNVGEKATVTIPKSSAGRVLISIENGSKVISRNWVKTSATEDTKYSFTVSGDMNPNFYIFASLLQPHAQTDNDLPIRMYGVLNINVKNDNSILTPVISMPDELRPEKEFTVSVSEKNKKAMTYTLAIVDEGLLDLTAFKTPNAWSDFYAKQALGVRTWDMFDMVVGAHTGQLGPLLSIGGDESLQPKSNPFSRFKPVVKFMGPYTLKKGSSQQHKVTLPSYIGSVRVMVVAGTAEGAYGNAEKAVPVKNPLMILSTLPRVAGPNEEILLPVNVFAMDKKVKNVTVTVKSTGLLQLTDGMTKSVTFTETGDKMVYFKLKAQAKTGYEKIEIKATGGGEISTETINIEVRNPNPALLMISEALVSAGETKPLGISMDAVQPEDWAKLEISRMPAVDLNKNLAYLLEYPHGCSEQVTSKVFPLLYITNFKKFSDKETEKIKYNINEGIKILSARQLGDGGIAYWPGNTYPTEWVTTYAGHFLIEAQRLGYNVPNSVISKWKQFQKKTAQSWNRQDLYSSYYNYSMSDLQQAYRLYTLALAGNPELGAMNRLKEMNGLSVQARWRLAAAYAVAGKKQAANELIAKAPDNVDKYSSSNNTYGDSYRDLAMIMETQLLLGRTDRALHLATKVSENLSSYYISTQSAAYSLIAMSKLAEKMGKGAISFEWTLNGVKQQAGTSGQVFQEIAIKPQDSINVQFTNKGQGELYVRLIGRSKPIEDTSRPTNNGLNLYVKYVDLDGNEINVQKLKQGTEFYAVVITQNVSGEYLTDMALSQIFASGWEIFNNRLFGNSDSNVSYNYQDIRDDRVLTYFNLSNGYSTSVRVRLQAAYCGKFFLPAVVCDAMYKPETQSKTQGMWVEVIQ
ncbi:MAG: alpha-2-macroglobulin family protein [Dysgonomonas sp.]